MSKKVKTAEILEMLPVAGLLPYARNSRTHSDQQVKQIAASIKEFGFINPIIVDADNTIVAGHGRLAAAIHLGLDLVPCIKATHLTDNQRRAYIIADNKLALNAAWDEDMLRVELEDLNAKDFDLSLVGFDADELNMILNGWDSDIEVPHDLPDTSGLIKVTVDPIAREEAVDVITKALDAAGIAFQL